MQHQLRKRGAGRPSIRPEFVQVRDKIIASAPWSDADDPHQERVMVFTVRDDKIVDMQGFTSRREAERFASRR